MANRDLCVGLTFDLRADFAGFGLSAEELAEFDQPATIDALEGALRTLGHTTERIGGVKALVARLHAGARWDLVFNVAEGRFGFGREAQVPALLDAYEIAYTFSDPLVSALTLHKGLTKHVLRDTGLPTAPFCVVHERDDLARVDLQYPLLAKPVAEGTSKGIGTDAVVQNAAALGEVAERLLARYRQPVLVEEFLPGRELTVGIVGTGDQARAVGALEVTLLEGADQEVCTFRNKEECENLVRYALAADAEATAASDLAVRAWRALGCRDAGRVDLRADRAGRMQILELNPLSGMHPTHSDLPILWHAGGRPYHALVDAIVRSAAERIATPRAQPCAS